MVGKCRFQTGLASALKEVIGCLLAMYKNVTTLDIRMKYALMLNAMPRISYRSVLAQLVLGAVLFFAIVGTASAGDSHANYYYPEPQTKEVYVSPLPILPTESKRSRVGFTVGLNQRQLSRSYAPQYHIFAKGAHAQKMIIVAAGNENYNTLYRLRALLASLTSTARTSPLFSQAPNPEELNFLDLATMAGFTQVTVSDGEAIAHRIKLISEN